MQMVVAWTAAAGGLNRAYRIAVATTDPRQPFRVQAERTLRSFGSAHLGALRRPSYRSLPLTCGFVPFSVVEHGSKSTSV